MDAITGGFDAGTALTAGQLCGALPEGLDSTSWKRGQCRYQHCSGYRYRKVDLVQPPGTYINLKKGGRDRRDEDCFRTGLQTMLQRNGDDWGYLYPDHTARIRSHRAGYGKTVTKNYVLKKQY